MQTKNQQNHEHNAGQCQKTFIYFRVLAEQCELRSSSSQTAQPSTWDNFQQVLFVLFANIKIAQKIKCHNNNETVTNLRQSSVVVLLRVLRELQSVQFLQSFCI